ncbi:MAG TPA: endonuclease III domain-containing protein [Spirochaetota bacterium]|nr:endonuclease III domain-containing protein [Spirochaetota bacterium]
MKSKTGTGRKLNNLYQSLLKTYGPQGWWPLINKKNLKCEYKGKKKLTDREKFEIAAGAVLTQNTNWYPNAVSALQRLVCGRVTGINAKINFPKNRNHLTPLTIARLTMPRLQQLIQPAGFFRQKALYLKALADFFLQNKTLSRNSLLEVKGIGMETADSILLYAFHRPFFIIDAYTRRILSTVGISSAETKYNDLQKLFTANLYPEAELFKEFHALLVKHGKLHYSQKPYGQNDKLLKRL